MKILILSWRDPQNPKSGGAEVVMFRYVQNWIAKGHQVWWLSNSFASDHPPATIKDFITIRVGPRLPYHNTLFMLFLYPLFILNIIISGWGLSRLHKFDLTIDTLHGLPLFSFLYPTKRKVLWVCEVAGQIWDKMYPFPINLIGRLLEQLTYILYSQYEVWAISVSTKKDILDVNPNLSVAVIPLGIETANFHPIKKFPFPSALFVARVVKMKGIESALFAAEEISKTFPNFKLFIVGRGNSDYISSLKHSSSVKFLGPINDQDRNKLYAKCHFLFHPSYKEGFGLTVLEAGASKTPTIARARSAMDELIYNGKDGFLFTTDREIVDIFIKTYNTPLYHKIAENIYQKSKSYDWKSILVRSGSVTSI